jgi:hypothetical protein
MFNNSCILEINRDIILLRKVFDNIIDTGICWNSGTSLFDFDAALIDQKIIVYLLLKMKPEPPIFISPGVRFPTDKLEHPSIGCSYERICSADLQVSYELFILKVHIAMKRYKIKRALRDYNYVS